MTRKANIVAPDFELANHRAFVSVWHVLRGRRVEFGEPLVEVVAGPAAIDIPAPASGVLDKVFIREDRPIIAGDVLGAILLDD